jgi:hypothetical protein
MQQIGRPPRESGDFKHGANPDAGIDGGMAIRARLLTRPQQASGIDQQERALLAG